MKRMLCLTSVFLALQLPIFAQTASSESAVIDKQASEERYKRMSADMEQLQEANAALQKKIDSLEERLSKMSEEITKASNKDNTGSLRDDLKLLRDKIQEVDKKRESDKQVISDEIKKSIAEIERAVVKANSARATVVHDRPAATAAADTTTSTTSDKNYSYTIQEGDTLSAIVVAYNKKFQSEGMKKISMKKVQDANPAVNWNRLRVGQKIVIPAPEG